MIKLESGHEIMDKLKVLWATCHRVVPTYCVYSVDICISNKIFRNLNARLT